MHKIAIVLAIMFVIGIVPLISLSYSEYASPKKQIESGVLSEDVMCRDNKVLVLRSSGNIACVFEKTANKLNWEIIQTVFEIKNNRADSLNIDLSEITLKSNVLEGDYKIGLFTESMKVVLRAPAPLYYERLGLIINQDGSFDAAQAANFVSLNNSQQTKQIDDYLKYFPEYIPDGLELKFFTFESSSTETARLWLIYAPIVTVIDPHNTSMGLIQDIGGIDMLIEDTPDTWHDKDGAFDIYVEQGAELTTINENTVAHGISQVLWENSDGVTFHITSYSYNGTEMLKMAQKALEQ